MTTAQPVTQLIAGGVAIASTFAFVRSMATGVIYSRRFPVRLDAQPVAFRLLLAVHVCVTILLGWVCLGAPPRAVLQLLGVR